MSDKKLVIRPEAERDITEAFFWYESKLVGLGVDFLLQVEIGLESISKEPHLTRLSYLGTRRHLLKRFPYSIVYLENHSKLVVLGVFHGKRNPEQISKRIDAFDTQA
ncbi:MAG: type II toxin-antitoxin system RelE/ParE family toxin [Candidatus Sumerlaeia bacterium]|nr:type II toxin-antitoxin system RelE/ParE family toxin [Candidatus Sumerlaeia bacterium]